MRKIAAILCLCLCLCGCKGGKPEPTPELVVETPAVTAAPTPTPTPTPEPEPTLPPEPEVSGESWVTYKSPRLAPESAPVGEEYFADAAFIGDSRTDGLRIFSGITGADFIVHTGLSVFQVETKEITYEGEKMTVLEALGKKEYGKVYLCLGLNELGMNNDQGYYDHFAWLVDAVREQQPQADIYIQLIVPVNEEKCGEKGVAAYVNNGKILVYNDLLVELAQEKGVWLLDPAQAIVDETGVPAAEETSDGVHFKKDPYVRWYDYLKCHTAP